MSEILTPPSSAVTPHPVDLTEAALSDEHTDDFGNSTSQAAQVRALQRFFLVLILLVGLGLGAHALIDQYRSMTGTIIDLGTDDTGSWAVVKTNEQTRQVHFEGADVSSAWAVGDSYPFLAHWVEDK